MEKLKIWLVLTVTVFLLGWMLVILAVTARAQEYITIAFDDMRVGDLASESFVVSAPLEIRIEAVGAVGRASDDLYAYAWILNDDTRRPEWVMDYDNTDRMHRDRNLREFQGELDLDPGSYTVYYYAGHEFSFGGEFRVEDLGDILALLNGKLSDEDEELYEQLRLVVTSSSSAIEVRDTQRRYGDGVALQILAEEDDFYRTEGFTLERPMTLRIYAIGEYSKGDRVFVDGSWIVNADTREKAWIMERWNTEPAGGAKKNRMFDDLVSLPAGNYLLYCSNDDSHSPEEWNAAPPYDPLSWGVTITVDDPSLLASVKPYRETLERKDVLAITRVGDDEYDVRYMTITEPVKLHVYAIGECTDEFFDYGWIEELSTMDRVWEMNWRNTEHAGGAAKNRMFDGVVEFDPGKYAVYYLTDDSHSYERWNASPPFDQESYGISLFGIGDDFDESSVVVTRQRDDDENTLVSITAVGDWEEEKEFFNISVPTRVRIYAIGEGMDNRMYDYAWIEDANTERVIWEMRYRKTDHAGGAKKNRMVDTVILLEPGDYEAYYITDDSHSFEGWNQTKPRDPIHWGITITKVD